MKKFVSLFVCIVIICSASSAYASVDLPITFATSLGSRSVYPEVTDQPYFPVQTCYLIVVLAYEQPDGTYTKVVQQIPAYDITYHVTYGIGPTGKILGGAVFEPELGKISTHFPYDLGLSLTYDADPTKTYVAYLNDKYEVYIGGGLYTVTYNDTFYFDMYGNIIDTNSTSIERAYYYEETNPQPAPFTAV